MKKKTILIFIDWYLPGYKAGGPITSVANLVSHLSNDFNFKIITTDTDYLETEPYPDVESNKWNIINNSTEVYYFSTVQISIKNIKNLIATTDFDIVYINGIYSFYFSIIPLYLTKKRAGKKIFVASRGMLSEHAFSRKSLKKNVFLKIAKFLGLYKNIIFHATSDDEFNSIKKIINKNATIKVIPNLPKRIKNLSIKQITKNSGELRIVSIARISEEKNTLFALEQLLSIKTGKIIFDLYGSINNKSYWQKCLEVIEKMPINIKVTHKGKITNTEVMSVFSKYHFSFMPSLGENFGHSILESFIAGIPVITSQNTPWRNLSDKKIGWDIDLQNIDKFTEVIDKCVNMSQNEYSILEKNAKAFGKNVMEDKEIINRYKELFKLNMKY